MSIHPTAAFDEVAWIDSESMREIDRVMVEDLGITLLQMMENAGRSLAELVTTYFTPTTVTVLAGAGGNGGGGLAAARHLHNAGIDVGVGLSTPVERLGLATLHQHEVIRAMGVSIDDHPDLGADVVVDAMIGYSLEGPLRGKPAEVAVALGASPAAVVSLDVPSGVDATTGEADGTRIRADVTMTLCLPKTGLRLGDDLASGVGDLFLADISVPAAVAADVSGGPAPPFGRGRILRLVP